MSRPRTISRTSTAQGEISTTTTSWHNLVDTLRQLSPMAPGTRIVMDEERNREMKVVSTEKKVLDEAMERITDLIAVRRQEEVDGVGSGQHIPVVQVSTPGSTGGASIPGSGGGPNKRKRRTSLSISASPAPPAHDPSLASPLPRSGTPGSTITPGSVKNRKDAYGDQLPLQPGRKVAFKVPSQKTGKAATGEGDDDDWILATVKRCIGQDKQRYEVQDADDSNVTYNTTLRSIIPLPDATAPSHVSSHPSNLEDFPRGTQVLALYPDTTSFYRATVVSAPMPGTGMGLGVRGGNGRPDPGAKKDKYRLEFVDDGDNVSEVDKFWVVAYPGHGSS